MLDSQFIERTLKISAGEVAPNQNGRRVQIAAKRGTLDRMQLTVDSEIQRLDGGIDREAYLRERVQENDGVGKDRSRSIPEKQMAVAVDSALLNPARQGVE